MADILITDDDSGYREAFRNGLEQLGHRVQEAPTAEVARGLLKTQRFDVVFLDVLMPGGGAVTMVHEISQDYPDLPMVVITGRVELFDTPLFREGLRKAASVLRKTASLSEINDTIRYIVR
jgi:DNA-binding NtrC family response regulator